MRLSGDVLLYGIAVSAGCTTLFKFLSSVIPYVMLLLAVSAMFSSNRCSQYQLNIYSYCCCMFEEV